MAKINFYLNGTKYSIDESAVAPAKDSFKQHLSNVMNGSGAMVKLDGTSYNIDFTKLSAAKNNFVSHLGTIAGSGTKVSIGGVEYSVDSSKLSGAMSELESDFEELGNSGDSDTDSNVITWDGNTEGHYIVHAGEGLYFAKVSDVFLPKEQAIGGTLIAVNADDSTEMRTITEEGINVYPVVLSDPETWGSIGLGIISVHSAETMGGLTFERGVYFAYREGVMHVSSFVPAGSTPDDDVTP